MRISAFSIPDFNRIALIAPGYGFMIIALFFILLFIFINIIILPLSCFLFPNHSSSGPSDYGLSSCSFSWRRQTWDNTHGANYFCLNAPEFHLFPFMVIAVVATSYVVYSFEKK